MLNDMRNRGYENILISCVNSLSSFSQAIKAMYPKTQTQHKGVLLYYFLELLSYFDSSFKFFNYLSAVSVSSDTACFISIEISGEI